LGNRRGVGFPFTWYLLERILMKNTKSIKQVLSEALGVPENIVELSSALYDVLVDSIPDTGTFDTLQNEVFEFEGDFNIADYKFKGVKFIFNLEENPDVEVYGMSTHNLSRVTKKFKIKTKVNHKVLEIMIMIAVPKDMTGRDIKKYFTDNKVEIVGSISHELKHYYDNFVKPKSSLVSRSKYMALTGNKFSNIHPLNEFIHHMYFIHNIENLVRPSEFAAALHAGEVTKKGFLEFLQNHAVYKKLKDIQNFTYEGLRESLDEYLPRIKFLFDKNGIDYNGLTDDEIIDRLLELFVNNLQVWEAEAVEDKLITHPLQKLIGLPEESQKFFEKYLNSVKDYDGDFQRFFKDEEKKLHYVATNMIKKIAKLYDMAQDVKTESIINWELWHKLKGTDSKIVTEFKYPRKKS
jgi:hypothetical protein